MHADNRRGILAMSLAMAFFIANDALVKQVSATLPGPQLIFIRGLMATTLVLIMAQAMGHLKNWRLMLNKRLWIRGSVDAAASLAYLTAVFHLPLANATAINLSSPLFITVFAIVFFKEQVALQRGLLILLGFSGVLLVVQPSSEGFNVYAWLAVLGTLLACYARHAHAGHWPSCACNAHYAVNRSFCSLGGWRHCAHSNMDAC